MRRRKTLVVACSIVASLLLGAGTGWAQTAPGAIGGSVERAVDRELHRRMLSTAVASTAFLTVQQRPKKRSWIGRHPVLVGALVGFGAGYLIGYSAGDDAVFDDFTAGFNGIVLGGAGALTGAVVGAVVTRGS